MANISCHAKPIATGIPKQETGEPDQHVSAHKRVGTKWGKPDRILQEQKPILSHFLLLAQAI